MVDLTQMEIELIVSLVIAVISLATGQAGALRFGDTLMSRFFAMICLLAMCGVSYNAYLKSRDIVFFAIALISALLLLFFFAVIASRRSRD
jgi:hypothetical protein